MLYCIVTGKNIGILRQKVFIIILTHQRHSVTLKMHQTKSRLGLCPRSHWGSLERSPRPLARL